MKLLTRGNTKTLKGEDVGYLTYILHLAPSWLSGRNTCPSSSAGCRATCLNTAGRGRFNTTQLARLRKTHWFFSDRIAFMNQLVNDVRAAERKAQRTGLLLCIRLNGTSDIRWENISVGNHRNIFEMFPHIQFYDYTKHSNRFSGCHTTIPANYHLTFSRSENNDAVCKHLLGLGVNVAVVFKGTIPPVYFGYSVIDGNENDLRFLDPSPVVVGLTAKGLAKKDVTGFVV